MIHCIYRGSQVIISNRFVLTNSIDPKLGGISSGSSLLPMYCNLFRSNHYGIRIVVVYELVHGPGGVTMHPLRALPGSGIILFIGHL